MAAQLKAKGATVLRLIDCQRQREDSEAEQTRKTNGSILRCLLEQNANGELGPMVISVDNKPEGKAIIYSSGDRGRGLFLVARAAHRLNCILEDDE